jgi:Domain of unknown function (DUF4369)
MRYLIIALLSVLVVSCNQHENANELQLTANIKGLKKGKLYIQKIVDTSLVAIDSIVIDGNSQFSTTIALDSPQMFYLFLDRGVTNSIDNNLPFFAEPGKMTIETTLDHFLSDAKITGSKNHQQYEDFKKGLSRYNDRNLELMEAKFNAIKTGNPKLIDSLEVLQDATIKRRYLYAANFAINHKDAEIAPFVALSEIPDINLKLLDTIQKSMTPKVAKSYYGKRLVEFYKERKKNGEW